MKSFRHSFLKKRGFVLITFLFFLISVLLHWTFGWKSFKEEQKEHGQTPVYSTFINETLRDTFENWQSEFLQLIWQVAGLAFLWHTGSSQSKEGDDRKEEKLDYILKIIDPEKAEIVIKELEEKFPKK
jgi:hypothetical protein